MTDSNEGKTPSEKYLKKLCHKAFLSLWSFVNPYTSEGRKGGKGQGKELCDLLVIFGNNLLIFSVKSIEFNEKIDTTVAWKRWYKKAVKKSANQIFGAETWIKKYPRQIFIDSNCEKPLPRNIPTLSHFPLKSKGLDCQYLKLQPPFCQWISAAYVKPK